MIREQLEEEVTIVSTTDSVCTGEYISATGYKYQLMDEDGATIAQTTVGDVDYALVVIGFSETELYKMIDSLDLNIYR